MLLTCHSNRLSHSFSNGREINPAFDVNVQILSHREFARRAPKLALDYKVSAEGDAYRVIAFAENVHVLPPSKCIIGVSDVFESRVKAQTALANQITLQETDQCTRLLSDKRSPTSFGRLVEFLRPQALRHA